MNADGDGKALQLVDAREETTGEVGLRGVETPRTLIHRR